MDLENQDETFKPSSEQWNDPMEYRLLMANWDRLGIPEAEQQSRLRELNSLMCLQRQSDERYHDRTTAVGMAETAASMGFKQTMSNRYGHKVKPGNKLTSRVRGKRNGGGDMI